LPQAVIFFALVIILILVVRAQATRIAAKTLPALPDHLPPFFYARPAEQVATRAYRLPAGKTPTQWRAAVGRDCPNGISFIARE